MTSLIAVASFLGALAFLPWVAGKWLEDRIAPKGLAGIHVLTLIGLALLPIGWLVCLAGGIGNALYPRSALSISCWIAKGGLNPLRLGTEIVSALFVLRLIWSGWQVFRATSLINVDDNLLSSSVEHTTKASSKIVIVPTDALVAFASGIRRPKAVISSRLLGLLEPSEQDAVIEHELAHLRLGHPRILFLGATVALAYPWLPPVQSAFNGLRRELEAAADDQVVARLGTNPLLHALAKVGLQRAAMGEASFADPDTLRYRLHRLQERKTMGAEANIFGMGIMFTLVTLLSWSACVLFEPSSLAVAFLLCLIVATTLGIYTIRPWSNLESRKSSTTIR